MKKIGMWGLIAAVCIFAAACGGGGGGGSVTCAPDTLDPTIDVSGNWQVYVDNFNTDCDYPPTWVSCNVTMTQNDNGNVSISAMENCTVDITIEGQHFESSDYTSISNTAGAVNGTTFYWVGRLNTNINEEGISYSETDVVSCNTVSNFGHGSTSTISTTTTWSSSGESGDCSGTATVTFSQI